MGVAAIIPISTRIMRALHFPLAILPTTNTQSFPMAQYTLEDHLVPIESSMEASRVITRLQRIALR